MSLVLVLLGAATMFLGRHSVLGLCVGAAFLFTGWLSAEVRG